MEFNTNLIKNFKINGELCTVHHYALKRATIFNSLFDTNTECPNIEVVGAMSKDFHIIWTLLYGNRCKGLFNKTPVEEIVRMTSIMMYMGLDITIINEAVTEMLDNDIDIILELIKLGNYHECMKIIVDNHCYSLKSTISFIEIVESINKSLFPDSFKIFLVNKLMVRDIDINNFDYILGITYEYENNTLISNILDVYIKNNTNIGSGNCRKNIIKLYQTYLHQDIFMNDIIIIFAKNKTEIIEISVYKKPIELIQHEKTYTKGTLGANLFMTFATHISKILLGLATL